MGHPSQVISRQLVLGGNGKTALEVAITCKARSSAVTCAQTNLGMAVNPIILDDLLM
jgi:hypothetical protein